MIIGKKKKNLPVEVTPAYMPKIMELLQGAKYDAAMEELGKAAQDYFQRVSKATETIHGHDAGRPAGRQDRRSHEENQTAAD